MPVTPRSPDSALLYGLVRFIVITDRSPEPDPSESDQPAPFAFGPGPVGGLWPAGSYAIGFAFAADPPARLRWVRIDILTPGTPG